VSLPRRRSAVLALAATLLGTGIPLACQQLASRAKLQDRVRALGLREGDILFQALDGRLCALIEGATGSRYTHCGLVVRRADGSLAVLEAIGPVQETPLLDWIRRGRGHAFDAYRLREPYRNRIAAFVAACRAYCGRPYDSRFRMDDEAIYCSELIYKGFQRATGEALGTLVRVRDLSWQPHEEEIRDLEGGPVPLDRELITPRDLARARQLDRICADLTPPCPDDGGAP